MDKIRLGILRGGGESNYQSSIYQAGVFIKYLRDNFSEFITPVDIFIDKENIWHVGGVVVEPYNLIHRVDFVWNFSHPSFSVLLSNLKIPNVLENIFANGFFESKEIIKKIIKENILEHDVYIPKHLLLNSYQEDIDGDFDLFINKKSKEVFNKFSSPWMVSIYPKNKNTSPRVVNTFQDLVFSLEEAFTTNQSVLIEELSFGKKGTLYMLKNFRNQDKYVFPITGSFSNLEKETIIDLGRKIFDLFELSPFLKIEFNINNKNKIHISHMSFENFLIDDSLFTQSSVLVNAKNSEIILHLLNHVKGL